VTLLAFCVIVPAPPAVKFGWKADGVLRWNCVDRVARWR
jgi:hypothetical protein